MTTYSIDTAKAIDNLVKNGVEEKQAKAIVETFSLTQDNLVSKHDLDEAIREVKDEIQTLRHEVKEEIKDLRFEMQERFNAQLKWMIGVFFAGFGLLFAALKFFG